MRLLALSLIATLLFFHPALAIGPDTCRNLLSITRNSYCVSRDFAEYNLLFDRRLEPALITVATKGGHWVDMGAGEGQAQIQFLQRDVSRNIQVTSLAACIPSYRYAPIYREQLRHSGRYRFMESWFTDETPQLIGPVDLITDVYGVINYTKKEFRHQVLEMYVSMLNLGGMIFLTYEEEWIDPEWVKRNSHRLLIEHVSNEDDDEKMAFYTIITKKTK